MWLPIFTAGSFFISIIALSIAIMNFRRKTGVHVRGDFFKASSNECNDDYVSRIVIENLKDRPITIFCIYLCINRNCYLVVEDFEDKSPYVLKGFETYSKSYPVIQSYSSNLTRISLNALLNNKKAKSRLVLSTSEGKYVVPRTIPRWRPWGDFFKNHMTLIIRPYRLIHNGKSVGSNVKYLVDLTKEGKKETILICSMDLKKFRNFQLTEASLKSSMSLELFFEEQKTLGNVAYDSIAIYETDNVKFAGYKIHDEPWEVPHNNVLYYLFIGRLFTWVRKHKLRKYNKELALKSKKHIKNAQDGVSEMGVQEDESIP